MNFAVKFYRDMPGDTPEVVAGIPLDWIADMVELGEGQEPEEGWTVLTPEEYRNHTEFYKDSYDNWLTTLPGYVPPEAPDVSPNISPIIFGYSGVADPGRHLELFSGISSLTMPLSIVTEQSIRAITLSTSQKSTVTVGIFKDTDMDNPIYSVSLDDKKTKRKKSVNIPLNANDNIVVKVLSGSCNKPSVTLYVGESYG